MRRILEPWRIAALASGSTSSYTRVSFRSRNSVFSARVPSAEAWISVKDVLVLEEYESEPGFNLASLPPDSTVVDAGAFAGLFSIKASPCAGRVIAVEPSRLNYELLEENIKLNEVTNVEMLQMGLASSTGSATFRDAGTSSQVIEENAEDAYLIQTTSLDDLLADVERVDFLKMDIEGSEYDTLLGASDESVGKLQRIAAEVHLFGPSDTARLGMLLSRLKESGMVVTVHRLAVSEATFGILKPWRCSLVSFNGRNPILYRTFISLAYSLPQLGGKIRSSYDTGRTFRLFASRR